MTERRWKIPLARPDVDEETVQYVASALRSPILSIGPRLEAFEKAFARFVGADHAVGVSSGTAGLHLAMRVLDIGPGDEVVTTPFSFVASANCLLFEGARPVFVDIDPETFLLDLERVEDAIGPRTRALLPVHVFGSVLDMPRVMSIAKGHGLRVCEDACEAIGGGLGAKKAGSWGDVGVYGFYPNKQMTTGEGGMVVTSSREIAERLRSLRNHGRSPTGDGSFIELGYNYRMSELTAALGEKQLQRLDGFIERRQQVERWYHERLASVRDEIRLTPRHPERSPFAMVVQTKFGGLRDPLRAGLESRGIQTAIYFRAIHLEPFYRESLGFSEGQFPVTERAAASCVALPFSACMTERDVAEVADTVRDAVTRWLRNRRSVGA